jgi:hypothetical protein
MLFSCNIDYRIFARRAAFQGWLKWRLFVPAEVEKLASVRAKLVQYWGDSEVFQLCMYWCGNVFCRERGVGSKGSEKKGRARSARCGSVWRAGEAVDLI